MEKAVTWNLVYRWSSDYGTLKAYTENILILRMSTENVFEIFNHTFTDALLLILKIKFKKFISWESKWADKLFFIVYLWDRTFYMRVSTNYQGRLPLSLLKYTTGSDLARSSQTQSHWLTSLWGGLDLCIDASSSILYWSVYRFRKSSQMLGNKKNVY